MAISEGKELHHTSNSWMTSTLLAFPKEFDEDVLPNSRTMSNDAADDPYILASPLQTPQHLDHSPSIVSEASGFNNFMSALELPAAIHPPSSRFKRSPNYQMEHSSLHELKELDEEESKDGVVQLGEEKIAFRLESENPFLPSYDFANIDVNKSQLKTFSPKTSENGAERGQYLLNPSITMNDFPPKAEDDNFMRGSELSCLPLEYPIIPNVTSSRFDDDFSNFLVSMELDEILNSISYSSSMYTSETPEAVSSSGQSVGKKRKVPNCGFETSLESKQSKTMRNMSNRPSSSSSFNDLGHFLDNSINTTAEKSMSRALTMDAKDFGDKSRNQVGVNSSESSSSKCFEKTTSICSAPTQTSFEYIIAAPKTPARTPSTLNPTPSHTSSCPSPTSTHILSITSPGSLYPSTLTDLPLSSSTQTFIETPELLRNKTHSSTTSQSNSGRNDKTLQKSHVRNNLSTKVSSPGNPSSACIPSRFCHICTRATKPSETMVCGNVKRGSCRKIVCHRCFDGLPVDARRPRDAGTWECTHCRKACPVKAQCFTYKRVNQKRRNGARRSRKVGSPSSPGKPISDKEKR